MTELNKKYDTPAAYERLMTAVASTEGSYDKYMTEVSKTAAWSKRPRHLDRAVRISAGDPDINSDLS
jgi:hypothetical protein